jgi:hypothetical protein
MHVFRRKPMDSPVFSACLLSIYILIAAAPANAQQDPPARLVRLPNNGNAENPAQDAEEAKKAQDELEKKSLSLLERLISDSASFSLAENRIYVQGRAVEILWKYDEPRARGLAREVMAQIIANNSETEPGEPNLSSSVRRDYRGNLENLRHHLLNFLSSVDSKFALEFLRATRRPNPPPGRAGGSAEQEKNLEYQLAAQAAGSDPQMSFQMAQDLENLERASLESVIRRSDYCRQRTPGGRARCGRGKI